MATSKERFQLVFEAQESASQKIRALNKQIAELGGPKLVKSQREIRKLERNITLLSGGTKKATGIFTRFTKGIAAGNIIANVATAAFNAVTKAISQIGTATVVAANVEELGNVLQFVGQRAGYSRTELDGYVKTLRKSGIAQKESNQAILRALQGNIALTDAVKLGRVAQDAAVIGQTNSSEAFQTLIDAVVKGRVVMLKSLGIQGTFQAEYRKLAKTLGKTQVELTEVEKKQARLNLVFKGGEVIAGAYETAMGSASKQMRSYDRLVQDLQISIGQHLVPSFGILVSELSSVTKEMTSAFSDDAAGQVDSVSVKIGIFTANAIFAAKAMFNFGQIAFNAVSLGVIAPIEAAVTAFHALSTAMADPFNFDAWKQAGTIMEDVLDGFKSDWGDILTNIDDIDAALLQYEQTVARLEAPKAAVVDIGVGDTPGADALDETGDKTNEVSKKIADNGAFAMHTVAAVAEDTKSQVSATSSAMTNMMGSAVNGMIGSLVTGRQGMGEVFKGIAQDFMTFFIKKALSMVVSMFIPGLGGLLGGIFDTPVNDRMAADQGRDFMSWFIKGALAEAQGGSTLAVGVTGASTRIAPVAAGVGGGGGGGGMVMMNVNVSGNVMTDQFVERTLGPKLQRLVNSGRSMLSVQDDNQTGGRDVNIN